MRTSIGNTTRIWLLQRSGLSQQPGAGLQPALGIIPTLFGMQQTPGEGLPNPPLLRQQFRPQSCACTPQTMICDSVSCFAPHLLLRGVCVMWILDRDVCRRSGRLCGATDSRAAAPGVPVAAPAHAGLFRHHVPAALLEAAPRTLAARGPCTCCQLRVPLTSRHPCKAHAWLCTLGAARATADSAYEELTQMMYYTGPTCLCSVGTTLCGVLCAPVSCNRGMFRLR